MSETNENIVNEIFAYINDRGVKVFTPNLEFAHIMAAKYNTNKVFVEKF
jgi:superfamily II DNA or RNA helicase